MANRPENIEADALSSAPQKHWGGDMHVTKEQLAAAERTREYHVRRLQSRMTQSESFSEAPTRQEH